MWWKMAGNFLKKRMMNKLKQTGVGRLTQGIKGARDRASMLKDALGGGVGPREMPPVNAELPDVSVMPDRPERADMLGMGPGDADREDVVGFGMRDWEQPGASMPFARPQPTDSIAEEELRRQRGGSDLLREMFLDRRM